MGPTASLSRLYPPLEGCHGAGSTGTMGLMYQLHSGTALPNFIPPAGGWPKAMAPFGGYSRERLAGVLLPGVPSIVLPGWPPALGARLRPL